MKVRELPTFKFNIGNAISFNADVVATNESVAIGNDIFTTYGNSEANDADELIEVIEDIIWDSIALTDEDKEELTTTLHNGADMDIRKWWEINMP